MWQMIQFSRYLTDPLKKVIDPVIQRNAYFAHPENLLLCMIADERTHMRELGLRRILKAKQDKAKSSVRYFNVPTLNFNSSDYIELLNWKNCKVTVPPILSDLSEEQLTALVTDHLLPIMDFENFPCHTQSVERCVKLVTEAAAAVCGGNNRYGFIRTRLRSRAIVPTFETKERLL